MMAARSMSTARPRRPLGDVVERVVKATLERGGPSRRGLQASRDEQRADGTRAAGWRIDRGAVAASITAATGVQSRSPPLESVALRPGWQRHGDRARLHRSQVRRDELDEFSSAMTTRSCRVRRRDEHVATRFDKPDQLAIASGDEIP